MYVIKVCSKLGQKEINDLFMVYKQMIQDGMVFIYPGMELYLVDEEKGNCVKVG